MKNEKKTQLELSDFYLSAFCLAKGFTLIKIEKTNPKRALFIFEDKKDSQELIKNYMFGRELIEAKCFISAIKELKQLFYSNI